jgi:hypothetical protein
MGEVGTDQNERVCALDRFGESDPQEKAPAMSPVIRPRRSQNHLLPVVTALL